MTLTLIGVALLCALVRILVAMIPRQGETWFWVKREKTERDYEREDRERLDREWEARKRRA